MKNPVPIVSLACSASCGFVLMALPLQAAWVLVDNFNGYTAGELLAPQSDWVLPTGSNNNSTVANLGGNNVASMTRSGTSGNHTIYLPLGGNAIPNNSSATFFFRFQSTAANPNFNLGLTANSNPGNENFGTNQSQFRVGGGDAGTVNNNNLYVRNSTAFIDIGDFQTNEWYNLWMVVNNTDNRTTFYMSQGTDDGALIGDVAGYTFRAATTDPIVTLQAIAGSASPVYIDDIHIDLTGVNTTFIPEPSASLLAGIAALGLLRRRRG